MVFSSILFLFRFMPVALALYFMMPRRAKNAALFVLSLVFYSWGEVRYFPIMMASTIVDYAASLGIERSGGNQTRRRLYLAMSMVFNLGSLCFFKYTDFFIQNINRLSGANIPLLGLTLPLGISFYTFQTMSYTIDVYRGNVKAEHGFIDFGAFVTLFPQLIAGPIVRYTDVRRELGSREINADKLQRGVGVFIMGLGSKVLIANNIGSLWTTVENMDFTVLSTSLAWLGIAAFGLQIYFDFSGYSLMAIGLGLMLGFNFPQNFNYPYISKSVTEFWRRWHMTLGSWFRDYIYIPLGGNRKGARRQYLNLLVVWAATGFWHGASWNFVFWGLYFFVFICTEKLFLLKYLERSKVISHLYLLFLVLVGWVIFALDDISRIGVYLTRMFGFYSGNDWVYYMRNYAVTFVIAILLCMPVLRRIRGKIGENHFAVTLFSAAVFLVSVAYLVDSSYNPFLYFRF